LIITRTPVRVSFLGGGTDYPEHYRLHGGQTLGASINRYSYLTVNEHENLSDYSIRVSYSRLELCQSVDEIEHPAVRECLRFLGLEGGIEIHYVGDLPARTGLGSSSSFTVGLLHALHAFKGELVCQRQLAEEAVHVERDRIGERVGVQDQYTCAHGGLLHLRFACDGKINARPVPLLPDRLAALQDHLMLFFTKIRRNAHEILDEQLDQTRRGTIADDLGQLGSLVDQGLDILTGDGPIAAFGELLHTAWTTKRRLSSKVSTPEIDAHYERARQAGAVGGKLLGAGGGGFLLLLVPPDDQHAVAAALGELHRVRFRFEASGSSVLFYQPA
jgi:D-glycero-alpha-D-manno-heptose-7-phosphate kinase